MLSLRYYVPILLQLTGIAGILAGGGWMWVGVAQLPLLALADAFREDDLRERPPANPLLMDTPLVIATLLGFAVVGLVAWRAGRGGLTVLETAGMIASAGWLTVVVMIPVTHELFHRRTRWRYGIGMAGQFLYLDYLRSTPHLVGHHLHLGTEHDNDTAPRGESMYGFVLRATAGNFRDSWAFEREALERRGLPIWSLQGRIARGALGVVALLGAFFLIGGTAGLAAGLVVTVIGRIWLEALNYLQHVGLVRGPGEEVAPRHVWNHLSPLLRVTTFEITNHCNHHLDPSVPYYRLRPDPSGPRMPGAFVCFLASIVPPLWNRWILWPRLREWDLHHATPAERKLAREANRRAGWPDWLAETEARWEPDAALRTP